MQHKCMSLPDLDQSMSGTVGYGRISAYMVSKPLSKAFRGRLTSSVCIEYRTIEPFPYVELV